MSGAVIEWAREAAVIARIAAVELEPGLDLVSDVDLEPVAAARRARRVLADIGIENGLGLLPEVIELQGEGQIVSRLSPDSYFLSSLGLEQRSVRKPEIHTLVLA